MPFNGSGVFQRVRNWVADATAGTKIRADFHDSEDDGFATGLSNCITKDGQTLITQNIPFNSKRITGLADPSGAQDAATKAYADTKEASTGTRFCPPGAIMDFGTPTAPAGWVECDGQSYAVGAPGSTYYALWQAIGYTWGGAGANFNAPQLKNRFRRHRDATGEAGAVATLKASANLAHGHALSGAPTLTISNTDGAHQHGVFLTDPGHTHTVNAMNVAGLNNNNGGGGGSFAAGSVNIPNTGPSTTGMTIGSAAGGSNNLTALNGAHGHTPGWVTNTLAAASDGGTEARPLSAAVLTCIKL